MLARQRPWHRIARNRGLARPRHCRRIHPAVEGSDLVFCTYVLFGCVFDCGHSCKKQDLTPGEWRAPWRHTRARPSSQLEASERVAGASAAGLVPDQNPSFHKLLDVAQRGIG